ncbi:MAG: hypothetical protein OIF55_17925 [Amphritea sp.]|nr:hypothetical protein [Amphritea sp.]
MQIRNVLIVTVLLNWALPGYAALGNDIEKLLSCEADSRVFDNPASAESRTLHRVMASLESGEEDFVSARPVNVFGMTLHSFKPGAGMSPGFRVTYKLERDAVRKQLEERYGIHFEQCNKRSCFTESESRALVLGAEAGLTYFFCAYTSRR